jgi:Na+-transporting NADH:ubiquinone oxidoreductase subunit F
MKIFLRKLHKWVGLAIGIQLLLWVSSGVMMAQLDPDRVSGSE